MPTLPSEARHRSRTWAACALAALVAILSASSLAPQTANAVGPLSWSASAQIDNQAATSGVILAGLSCPTTGLCVAVDNNGNVVTSTNPTGGASAWTKTNVDAGGGAGKGVFCQSTSLCVVVDGGDIVTSTDPTGGTNAWTVATIAPEYVGFTGIACASASLCVTGDAFGDLVASTNPTGGASEWHRVMASSEADYFTSVACPSTALCVAVDGFSGFATSTAPASSNTWHFTGYLEGGTAAVSCPSVSLCVGVGQSKVAIATNPTGGKSAWTLSSIDGNHSLKGVSCPSTSMCVAVDDSGNVLTATNPTGGAEAWTAANIDGTNSLTAVSCPTETLCLAVDSQGNVLVGAPPTEATPPGSGGQAPTANPSNGGSGSPGTTPTTGIIASVSPAQIAALLSRQLTPTGKAAKIGSLLKAGGFFLPFTALEAGTVSVGWYQVPSGAKLAKKIKAKPVLVASGKLTFPAAGTGNLKLKLTAAGKRLLKHAKRMRLTAKGTFAPNGASAVTAITTTMLKR